MNQEIKKLLSHLSKTNNPNLNKIASLVERLNITKTSEDLSLDKDKEEQITIDLFELEFKVNPGKFDVEPKDLGTIIVESK